MDFLPVVQFARPPHQPVSILELSPAILAELSSGELINNHC